MYHKLGFLGKQMLLYSILLFILVAAIIAVAWNYTLNTGWEKAKVTQEQMTLTVKDTVDAQLDQMFLIGSQVAHDTEIVNVMGRLYEEGNEMEQNYFAVNQDVQDSIAAILERHNLSNEPLSGIDVRNAYGDYICTKPTPERLQYGQEFFQNEALFYHMHNALVIRNRGSFLLGPENFSIPEAIVGENNIHMIIPIKNEESAVIYGWVDVFMRTDELYEQLRLDQRTGIDIYLMHEHDLARGTQFYPTDKTYPDITAGNYYETQVQSSHLWYIVLLQNKDEFAASYRIMLMALIASGVVIFLILFLCIYLLVRHTSKPILELNERVKAASLENMPELSVSGNALDEVKELERSFDTMMQRMKVSVQLEKKAYLNALQAQMKPHFLYNCLATVSGMGVEAHSREIPKFCNRLAAILRYASTYDEKPTTLADELQNVQNYLELMQLRYEGDFTYELDVDESLLPVILPRLTLQPLVENCFDHGFREQTPPWFIRLRIYSEDDRWCVELKDNGSGMEEETYLQLMHQLETACENITEAYPNLQIGGLGLVNTILRLQLLTDGRLDFAIEPNEPTGTIVRLKGDRYV